MNWFIRTKMFAYSYNKCRPLNRVQFVKCSVNSLLLSKFLLLQKVCGTLDHYFITTHTIINSKWSEIHFCVIIRETRRTCIPWSFSRREMNKHDSGLALI